MRFFDQPRQWKITLRNGQVVDVWADHYSRDGAHYTFISSFEIEEGEDTPPGVLRDNWPNPLIVEVVVARFPKSSVRLSDDDEEWPAIYSHPPIRGWRFLPLWPDAVTDVLKNWLHR